MYIYTTTYIYTTAALGASPLPARCAPPPPGRGQVRQMRPAYKEQYVRKQVTTRDANHSVTTVLPSG